MQIDEDLIRQVQSYIFGKTGIRYFGRVKMTPKNLMVSCPYHKGGQEHKPSCGIKLQNDEKGSVGLVHCFSCGITTDMSSMMKDLLGPIYNEDEVEAKFGFKTLALNASLVVPDKPLFSIPNIVNVSEGVLRGFRKYHPYLAQRGISENTARIYDIGFDDYNGHITFPIRDINKNCIGIGRRSIYQKQYLYPPEMIKPLYGLYELSYPINYLYIVEGPFNLWSLYEWGKRAVALLGTGTKYQYQQLLKVDCQGYVLCLDPDNAGRNGTYKLANFLIDNDKKKIFVGDLPDGRDVNDLSYEEFRHIEVLAFREWQQKYKIF